MGMLAHRVVAAVSQTRGITNGRLLNGFLTSALGCQSALASSVSPASSGSTKAIVTRTSSPNSSISP
jgi:hypothetical protein